jgi:hypothetical protein
MSGFLYFVEGAQALEPAKETLRSVGAAYALTEGMYFQHTGIGPSGSGGGILCSSLKSYDKDSQVWQLHNSGQFWIGVDTHDMPRPKDLALKSQISGHLVKMEDGNDWLIPAARSWGHNKEGQVAWCRNLPCVRVFEDGSWKDGEVIPKHRALWNHMLRLNGIFVDAMAGDMTKIKNASLEEEADFVLTALRTNYRVGPIEASMLGIMTDTIAGDVANAVMDMPSVEAILEKKAQGLEGGSG